VNGSDSATIINRNKNAMNDTDAIKWFKTTYCDRVRQAMSGTPFDVDMLAAIAYQETGYLWSALIKSGPAEEFLALCVGDSLDESGGRNVFPLDKADLIKAPGGAEMFAIARAALEGIASYNSGYRKAAVNPNKFCHGFGIFQYDIQFFKLAPSDPEFFLSQGWKEFGSCTAKVREELVSAMATAYGHAKKELTDTEMVYVAIAYNKGSVNTHGSFQQGHKDDGVFYGENISRFLKIARSV